MDGYRRRLAMDAGKLETDFRAAGVTSGDRCFFAFSFGPFLGFWTAYEAVVQAGCLCIPGGGVSTEARYDLFWITK